MATTRVQNHFRFRNDDGSETTASWYAALDTNITPVIPATNSKLRLRINVKQTGTTAATHTQRLYKSKNGGAYAQIGGSDTDGLKIVDSTNYADDAATTQQISSGGAGFVAGKMDDVSGQTSATGSMAQNVDTEHEYMLEIDFANIADGDTFDLRARQTTSALNTYNVTARITVTKNAPPTTALNSPADSATSVDTLPTLNFTGTDADAETVEYDAQIDTVNTFDSQGYTGAYVQSATSFLASGISKAVNISTQNCTLGNTLILVSQDNFGDSNAAQISSITDTSGNTWVRAAGVYISDGDVDLEVWYALNIAGGTKPSVTVNYVNSTSSSLILAEYSGILELSSLDKTKTAQGTSASPASGNTATLSVANELILGVIGWQGTGSASSPVTGYSNLIQENNGSGGNTNSAIASKIVSATTAQSIGMTITSQPWGAICLTFKLKPIPLIDKLSASDAGFTAGHPFASGAAKDYTVQSANILSASTVYYWRVRATDPTGSNIWGTWATTRSFTTGASAVALSGTVTASITEADIVAGGKTIILTLTDDLWVVAAGSLFDNQRQNIIDGIDSAQSEAHGWDAEVKAKIAVTDVVRTSDTVVTITLDAEAAYNITAQETITATVPGTALVLGGSDVASPTFTVDTVAGGNNYTKTFGETITLSSSITKVSTRKLSESISVSDSLSKIYGRVKSFSESVSVSDSFSKIYGRFVNFSESITISDSIIKLLIRILTFSESISVVDTIRRAFTKLLSESISITESFKIALTKIFSESETVVDSISLIRTRIKTFSESISLSDFILNIQNRFKTFSENISVADSIQKAITKVYADSIIAEDTIKKAITRVLTEAINITDSLITVLVSLLNYTDNINISDNITKTTHKIFSDAINITDSISQALGRGIAFVDNISVTDSIHRAFTRTFTEAVSLVDTFSKAYDRIRSFTESISLSDVFSKIPGKFFTDNISVTDSIRKFLNGASTYWSKIRKTSSSTWSKTAKDASGLWTKAGKTVDKWTKIGQKDD